MRTLSIIISNLIFVNCSSSPFDDMTLTIGSTASYDEIISPMSTSYSPTKLFVFNEDDKIVEKVQYDEQLVIDKLDSWWSAPRGIKLNITPAGLMSYFIYRNIPFSVFYGIFTDQFNDELDYNQIRKLHSNLSTMKDIPFWFFDYWTDAFNAFNSGSDIVRSKFLVEEPFTEETEKIEVMKRRLRPIRRMMGPETDVPIETELEEWFNRHVSHLYYYCLKYPGQQQGVEKYSDYDNIKDMSSIWLRKVIYFDSAPSREGFETEYIANSDGMSGWIQSYTLTDRVYREALLEIMQEGFSGVALKRRPDSPADSLTTMESLSSPDYSLRQSGKRSKKDNSNF